MPLVRFSDNFDQISLYQKIINYSGSVLATFDITMQTKQHAIKKSRTYSNRSKFHTGLFLWWKGFDQKIFKIFNIC